MKIVFIDVNGENEFNSYSGEAYLPVKGSFIEFEKTLDDDSLECHIFEVVDVIISYGDNSVNADVYVKYKDDSSSFRKQLKPQHFIL